MNLKMVDGRIIRREKSRQRIIDAVVQLINDGVGAPTAEQVGALAGVTMRTVFRHFSDMEALYREVISGLKVQSDALHVDFDPDLPWQEEFDRLLKRRAVLFEKFMPRAITAQALRHHSAVINQDVQQYSKQMRQRLEQVLPKSFVNNAIALAGIDALMSWDMWIRLRRDQKLSSRRAAEVIRSAVAAILKDADISNAQL